MIKLAPIALFVYKRIDTLKSTLDYLSKNKLAKDSDLYIFSDGYKSEKDKLLVLEVQKYIETINGFKSVTIFKQKKNLGLANSIIKGVSQILSIHDSVIVIEDDLITTQNFLSFMNASLNEFNKIEKVLSISGFSFNLGLDKYENGYFLPRGASWGWATWKNRWENIDWSVNDYEEFHKNKKYKIEFSKGGSDLNSMLKKQMNKKIDSWAIRWFYHQFKTNTLTFYPKYSKVINNGFGSNATHTKGSNKRYMPVIDESGADIFEFPTKIEIDDLVLRKFQIKFNLWNRIKSRIQSLIKI